MKLFANIINIKSTKKGTYPGDKSGESIIITQEGSAGKGETSQQYGQAGFISNPPANVKGLRFRIGSIDICISAFNYGVAFPEKQGETKVYSTDSDGVEKGSHYIDDQGVHTFNNGTDYAVAFEDLKSGYDQLKSDLNTFITAYNTHVHPTAPVGPTTPPSNIGSSSSASIDASKIESMRVP